MRFLRDGLDAGIIAVKLRNKCITMHCKGHEVMQGAGRQPAASAGQRRWTGRRDENG
jgi:hypothetical protein